MRKSNKQINMRASYFRAFQTPSDMKKIAPKARSTMLLKPETVSFIALAKLLERIAAEYQQRGIESVDLSSRDFYRVFGTDEMFEVDADLPSTIGIGSLHDDIIELTKLLEQKGRVVTAVDIERLGNLLRAVSEVL
jgi:hypothetical protein